MNLTTIKSRSENEHRLRLLKRLLQTSSQLFLVYTVLNSISKTVFYNTCRPNEPTNNQVSIVERASSAAIGEAAANQFTTPSSGIASIFNSLGNLTHKLDSALLCTTALLDSSSRLRSAHSSRLPPLASLTPRHVFTLSPIPSLKTVFIIGLHVVRIGLPTIKSRSEN